MNYFKCKELQCSNLKPENIFLEKNEDDELKCIFLIKDNPNTK